MSTHSFERRAAASSSPSIRERVERILGAKLEARKFRWTEPGGQDDRSGVDVFALLPNRKNVGVDVKDNRYGEVRLEYVSRLGEGIAGWTVNDRYITDYVLNLWPTREWLIDFPSLKAVAKEHRDEYARWYGPKSSHSVTAAGSSWETRFVPVPVGRLLFDIYGQTVAGTPLTADRLCPACGEPHPVGLTCNETSA